MPALERPEPPTPRDRRVSRGLPHPAPRFTDSDRAEALEVIGFVDPVVLAAVLGRAQPSAPLLVAARVGVEVADLRHAHWTALRDASKDISVAYAEAGLARRPSLAELLRRRYPPNGDIDEWIHDRAVA